MAITIHNIGNKSSIFVNGTIVVSLNVTISLLSGSVCDVWNGVEGENSSWADRMMRS